MFEQHQINLKDFIKKTEEQNFYKVKKLIKKYFTKIFPRKLKLKKNFIAKRNRFSFEIEQDQENQRRFSEGIKKFEFL